MVPDCLRAESTDCMLPSLQSEDLSYIKDAGWARVGIVAAVMDERHHLLMLKHKQSAKTTEGMLGPLAETAQVTKANGNINIETTAHTLSRAVFEELGVIEPSTLELRARRVGAWTINRWPVGVNHDGQIGLAVCPVVHIGSGEREMLMDTFSETEEITAIDFMDMEDVAAERLVRPGTHAWLHDIVASNLHSVPVTEREPIDFPDPSPLQGAVDIKFKDIDYL
jgi:hypothetical protein